MEYSSPTGLELSFPTQSLPESVSTENSQAIEKYKNQVLLLQKHVSELEQTNAKLEQDLTEAKYKLCLPNTRENILVNAAAHGDLPLVKYCVYVQKISVNSIGSSGNSVLSKAVHNGRTNVVYYLLKDCKASLESRPPPLSLVVENEFPNTTKVLLECGARVDQLYYQKTPFFRACELGHIACAEVLLNYGAKINVRCPTNSGNKPYRKVSALELSVINRSSKVFDWLLKQKGLDVNFVDKKNVSALHIACKICNVPAINGLLAAGANPNLLTNKGKRPLDLVSKANREEVKGYFEKYKAKEPLAESSDYSYSQIGLEKSQLI